jgi:acyl-CoA reductase-like NAD-dependent aldehyde dehydrogenase
MIQYQSLSSSIFCEKKPIDLYSDNEKISLGSYGMLTQKEALEALDAAVKAYDHGRGAWPHKSTRERIKAMENFVRGLRSVRDQIVELVMWEICKVREDAEKEVDRTISKTH